MKDHSYRNDWNPDEQITAEEGIAAYLFDNYREGFSEQDAADAGRDILRQILAQFRPDLFTECDEISRTKPGE